MSSLDIELDHTNGLVVSEITAGDPRPFSIENHEQEIVEVPLTETQRDMLLSMSTAAQAAGEVATAAVSVATTKQASLDQALKMILDIAGVELGNSVAMLDKRNSCIRLLPPTNTSYQ